MPTENSERNGQTLPKQDILHLRLLAIFHYVMAVLMLLLWLIYLILLLRTHLQIISMREQLGDMAHMISTWEVFTTLQIAWLFALMLITTAVFAVAGFLEQRRHYLFCMTVAGLLCLLVPLGTVLGVFTIIVLSRTSVNDAFAARRKQQLAQRTRHRRV